MNRVGIAGLVVFALALASPQLAEQAAADRLGEARVAAGKIMYQNYCRICHSLNPDTPSYGPTLVDVVGRKAGAVPGYKYSDAMQNAGIVWTEEALRAWMSDNTHFMPGTKMRHVGITDQAAQDFLIAYLNSISK